MTRHQKPDILVSDFDDTLFKRNHGLIAPMVTYVEQRGLPVYIVSYRAEDQTGFILSTLAGTDINIIGLGLCDSRKKDPKTKLTIIRHLMTKHNVVEVVDDDRAVLLGLQGKVKNLTSPHKM